MKANIPNVDKLVRLLVALMIVTSLFSGHVLGIILIIFLIFAGVLIFPGILSFYPIYLVSGISTKNNEK